MHYACMLLWRTQSIRTLSSWTCVSHSISTCTHRSCSHGTWMHGAAVILYGCRFIPSLPLRRASRAGHFLLTLLLWAFICLFFAFVYCIYSLLFTHWQHSFHTSLAFAYSTLIESDNHSFFTSKLVKKVGVLCMHTTPVSFSLLQKPNFRCKSSGSA